MSDPFVAEVRILACNFAPTGWAFCAGQLLPLSQNTALFSLLGTTYGGNGTSTFALPNLQGNVAMHPGDGPGLSSHDLGEVGGEAAHTLLVTEMPSHTHTFNAQNADGAVADPTSNLIGNSAGLVYKNATANTNLSPSSGGFTGSSQPHNNLMPYLTLNYCIALQGVFPPRG